MIEKTEGMLGGGVTKVVPVTERGDGKAREEHVPRIVGRNFPWVFATFQTKTQAESLSSFSETEKNFFHPGPAFTKGFFPRLNGGDFLADKGAGTELTCKGERFEGIVKVAGTGGAKVKNDEASSDRSCSFERGQRVALGKTTRGGAGVGKFVCVGGGAEKLDGDGTKVVKDVDLWGVGHFMFGQNSGPEAEPRVMAEFNVIKSKGGGLAEKIGPVGGAVGMPAGGEGEGGGGHRRVVSLKKRVGRRDFSGSRGAGRMGEGIEGWKGSRQNRGMVAKRISYRGKVQGVGFRYSVRQIAEGYTVSGHATNQPDGTVEVFLQGDRDEVEAMEKEIGESHLAGFIRESNGREVEAVPGIKGFQIQ